MWVLKKRNKDVHHFVKGRERKKLVEESIKRMSFFFCLSKVVKVDICVTKDRNNEPKNT